jgi:hypothetical protein
MKKKTLFILNLFNLNAYVIIILQQKQLTRERSK